MLLCVYTGYQNVKIIMTIQSFGVFRIFCSNLIAKFIKGMLITDCFVSPEKSLWQETCLCNKIHVFIFEVVNDRSSYDTTTFVHCGSLLGISIR